VQVSVSEDQSQLDVWAVADRLWRPELEPYMSGTITALTRINVLEGGGLLVRRVVQVGRIRLLGNDVTLENPLIEAWTPLSDSVFDSIALSVNNLGLPDRYYVDSQSIPNYPAWPVIETRGWAMAYDRHNLMNGATMSIVFGRDPGQVRLANGTIVPPRRFVLNTLDFSGGFGILPAFWPASLPQSSTIDQYFIFLPARGIQAGTGQMLDDLAARLPPPRVYHFGAALPGEISVIADRLAGLADEPRSFTTHLGTVE
jgi:hypothetical protein